MLKDQSKDLQDLVATPTGPSVNEVLKIKSGHCLCSASHTQKLQSAKCNVRMPQLQITQMSKVFLLLLLVYIRK